MSHTIVSLKGAAAYFPEDVEAANNQLTQSLQSYAACLAARPQLHRKYDKTALTVGKKARDLPVDRSADAAQVQGEDDRVIWMFKHRTSWEAVDAIVAQTRGTTARLVEPADRAAAGLVTRPGDKASSQLAEAIDACMPVLDPSRPSLLSLLAYDCMPTASQELVRALVDTGSKYQAQGGQVKVEIMLVRTSGLQANNSSATADATVPLPGDSSSTHTGVFMGARWAGAVPGGGPPTLAGSASFSKGAVALERTIKTAVQTEAASRGLDTSPLTVRVHSVPNTTAGWLGVTGEWLQHFAQYDTCTLTGVNGSSLALHARTMSPLDVAVPCTAPPVPSSLVLAGRIALAPLPMQLLLGGPLDVRAINDAGSGLMQLLCSTDTGLLLRDVSHVPYQHAGLHSEGPLYILMGVASGQAGGQGAAGEGVQATANEGIMYRIACREEALVHGLHSLVGAIATADTTWPDNATAALLASPGAAHPFLNAAAATACTVYDPLNYGSGAFTAGLSAHWEAQRAAAEQSRKDAAEAEAKAKAAEKNAARAAARKGKVQDTAGAQAPQSAQGGKTDTQTKVTAKPAVSSVLPSVPKGRVAAPTATAGASKGSKRKLPAIYDAGEDSEEDIPLARMAISSAPAAKAGDAMAEDEDSDSSAGLTTDSESDSSQQGPRRLGKAKAALKPAPINASRGKAAVPAKAMPSSRAPAPMPAPIHSSRTKAVIVLDSDEEEDKGVAAGAGAGAGAGGSLLLRATAAVHQGTGAGGKQPANSHMKHSAQPVREKPPILADSVPRHTARPVVSAASLLAPARPMAAGKAVQPTATSGRQAPQPAKPAHLTLPTAPSGETEEGFDFSMSQFDAATAALLASVDVAQFAAGAATVAPGAAARGRSKGRGPASSMSPIMAAEDSNMPRWAVRGGVDLASTDDDAASVAGAGAGAGWPALQASSAVAPRRAPFASPPPPPERISVLLGGTRPLSALPSAKKNVAVPRMSTSKSAGMAGLSRFVDAMEEGEGEGDGQGEGEGTAETASHAPVPMPNNAVFDFDMM